MIFLSHVLVALILSMAEYCSSLSLMPCVPFQHLLQPVGLKRTATFMSHDEIFM